MLRRHKSIICHPLLCKNYRIYPSSRRHIFIDCRYTVKPLLAGRSEWCVYVFLIENNLMETKSFQEYWVNRISIWLSLSVLTGGWRMVILFSQGVIHAHPVLLLSHFLKSILVRADPLSHRDSHCRSMWVSPHLCLLGHSSDFCSTWVQVAQRLNCQENWQMQLWGGISGSSDSVLIKTLQDFVEEEAVGSLEAQRVLWESQRRL